MLRQMNFVQSSNKLTKLAVKSAVSQPKALGTQLSYTIGIHIFKSLYIHIDIYVEVYIYNSNKKVDRNNIADFLHCTDKHISDNLYIDILKNIFPALS